MGMSATRPLPPDELGHILAETERSGLKVVLAIRNGLVAFFMMFIAATQGIKTGWFGILVISVFLGVGLAYHWLVVQAMDRQWMRFAFASLDMALLAVVAVAVPLSIHGEVPQIFVFRVYGAIVFFFLLATWQAAGRPAHLARSEPVSIRGRAEPVEVHIVP